MVLVHGITSKGLMTCKDVDGPIHGDLDENASFDTCEWVFPANSRKDYHLQMNSERFMAWVRYLGIFLEWTLSLHDYFLCITCYLYEANAPPYIQQALPR